jgi:hypothetical protein
MVREEECLKGVCFDAKKMAGRVRRCADCG